MQRGNDLQHASSSSATDWIEDVLTVPEIREIQRYQAPLSSVHKDHLTLLASIQQHMRLGSVNGEGEGGEGEAVFEVSDRRFVQIVRVLQISALCHGRSTVDWSDFLFIEHVLWSEKDDQQIVTALVIRCWLVAVHSWIAQTSLRAFGKLKARIAAYIFETESMKQTWLQALVPTRKARALNLISSPDGIAILSLTFLNLSEECYEWTNVAMSEVTEDFDVEGFDVIVFDLENGNLTRESHTVHVRSLIVR